LSKDGLGTKATKAPGFDIREYHRENFDYYGDIPLEEVARDIYTRGGYDKEFKDFKEFTKAAGIDQVIQEDIKRRTPSFIDKLSKAVNAVSGVALPSILIAIHPS